MTNYMKFKDEQGYLFAVRKDYCSNEDAKELAKKELFTEDVELSSDYQYMYHGFGKAVGMDEYENTWWLTNEKNKITIPVYVFREI